ncbi:MAG TPA: J domain-containing protein [Ktedonobacterales bacterium]
MADEPDYYAVLGLAPGAPETAIRLAYRQLARRYHPDIAETGDASRMARINEAYRVLSDAERRQVYDLGRGLPTGQPAAPSPSTARPPTPSAPATGTLRASPGPLRRLASLATADRAPVTALAFARGGQLAAIGLIDGRVLIWPVGASQPDRTLTFAATAGAGVLHEVRLSPGGAVAVAWGLLLGTRVWDVAGERALWTASANAPSGAMDIVPLDDPPRVRLALPDAPLALAEDDPFRWAHQGRAATAVFTRPLLAGPVGAQWAVPKRCVEGETGRPAGGRDGWRVYERILAADGTRLLTFAAPPASGTARATALHIWDLDAHGMLGGNSAPRRVARATFPPGVTGFPLAATPDLAWVATGNLEQRMRVAALGSAMGSAMGGQAAHLVETGPLPTDARAVLAPDASLLAVARGARLDVWPVVGGAPPQTWALGAEVTALAFAPDVGTPLLGLGLGNGVVEVWGA